MKNKLLQAIMERDRCSASEAQALIQEIKDVAFMYNDAEEALYEYGFEPDYVEDLFDIAG